MKLAGVAQELNQLLDIFFCFIDACDIRKRRRNLIFAEQFGFALTKAHRAAATTATALHLTHKEHEHGENQQDGETRNQQLRPYRLLLGLLAFNNNVVIEQIVHQLGVFDHGTNGLKTRAVFPLSCDSQAVNNHFLQTVTLHFGNKIRIAQLLGLTLRAEIIEYRKEYCGDR